MSGLVAPDSAKTAKWLADAFIQLIKTVTGPAIFVTVVIGIARLGITAGGAPADGRTGGRFERERAAVADPSVRSR